MLKIKNLKKFKKDFQKYKKDIESISNEKVKKDCYTLLNKLVEQYNYIDATHDVLNRNIDPTKIRENVEQSIQLRIELNKILKDSKN